MVQNGPNDHFGQNDLIPNWILAFARPKWTKMVHFGPFWPEEVHFGPFRSANRTLAIPENCTSPFASDFLSVAMPWVLFRPTFLSVRNSCAFVLYDLLKTD